MVDRKKYRRVPDLYTRGKTIVLMDGNPVYLRALNPFERQETLADANAARARLTLALEEIGSDDYARVTASFHQEGRERAVKSMLDARQQEFVVKAVNEIQADKDWKERLDVSQRSDEILARPAGDPEIELLTKINEEYLAEIQVRVKSNFEAEKFRLELLPEEELKADYLKLYRTNRGGEVATDEYRLTELWYAIRVCEAVEKDSEATDEKGRWDHSACESHKLPLYESKREVRDLPEDLLNFYLESMAELNMQVSEAKNSDRLQSSSGSSLQPSGAGESTPSTQSATPASVPGTSPQPSSTP